MISHRLAAGVYCIPNPTANAPCRSRPRPGPAPRTPLYLSDLLIGRTPVRRIGYRDQVARVTHQVHAHRNVTDAGTVVDGSVTLPPVVPGLNVGGPQLLMMGST